MPAVEDLREPGAESAALAGWQRLCLIGLVLVTTFAFLHTPGTIDVRSFWLPWMNNVRNAGLVKGFAGNVGDYPPLTSVYLLAASGVGKVLGLTDLEALKWTLVAFLIATSALFWLWTRALLLTTFLHLSLVLNSVALGYLDVFVTLPLLGALWALKEGRYTIFALLFAAACLSKWHPLIIAPFFLVYVFQKAGLRVTLTRVVLPGLLIAGCVLAVFRDSLIASLTKALTHPFLSGLGLNLHWVITYALRALAPDTWGGLADGQCNAVEVLPDSALMVVAKGLFWAVYASVLVLLWWSKKSFADFVFYTMLGFLTYCTLNTGVHENHLLLASFLATVLCFLEGGQVLTMLVIALLNNLNLFLFYGVTGKEPDFSRVAPVDLTLPTAALAVVNFLVLYRVGVARLAPATPLEGLAARALPRAVPLAVCLFLPVGMLLGSLTAPASHFVPRGALDAADAEQIRGWAFDPQHPDDPVRVEIYDGEALAATVVAGEFRQDLLDQKLGNGKHGFSGRTPGHFLDGKPHTLRLVLAGTEVELANKAITVSKPVVQPAPDSTTLNGSLDTVGPQDIAGWAWDSTHPDNPIAVDIYDGETLLGTVPANEFRPDLVNEKIGNGAHAFTFPTPQRLLDGKEHVIRVLATGTKIEIGSPRTFKSP
jgi:hypothetical protein